MEKLEDIIKDFENKKIKFLKKEHNDFFEDVLCNYKNKRFKASATLAAVLYEQIFTIRLVREISNPKDFVPSKDNISEQLKNLGSAEDEIINQEKRGFRQITSKLKELEILSKSEKDQYDSFYTEIRNPVVHGLSIRLFEIVENRKPVNPFELDSNFEKIYKTVSEMIILKIHNLMVTKKLLKT